MPDDSKAALEWQTYKDSLCSGCGQPKHESFAVENSDAYTAEPLRCHACAAQQRKSWVRSKNRDAKDPPLFGEYFAVRLDEE